ncbi:MAG: quaternary ammonium compound efflux SMR transporter SugE [Coxiellaceae bacterium]|nr:quaternary ammonium compound efflux SMR transporter SugE [Coxiellaceae bacterium]
MTWLALFVAGLFETGWAVGLKYTEGWTRLWPSIYTLIAMAISFFLLSYALKTLPIGTAYAIWTGIGAVGAVLFGIFFLHEPAGALRIFCIAVIIAGMIGLKLTSGH